MLMVVMGWKTWEDLCVKGRYGFDYVHHSDRLTTPLIRKEGMTKSTALIDPSEIINIFEQQAGRKPIYFRN